MLGLQVIFFQLMQFRSIEPWHFPAIVFLCTSALLGCVGAIFGIASWVIRKQGQAPVRTETMLLFVVCVSSLGFLGFGYGWQNIDLMIIRQISLIRLSSSYLRLKGCMSRRYLHIGLLWIFRIEYSSQISAA